MDVLIDRGDLLLQLCYPLISLLRGEIVPAVVQFGDLPLQVLGAAVRVKYRAERDERVLERAVVDVHAAPLRLHEACLA